MDGDYSDFPEEMPALYEPIVAGVADLVVGSRVLGEREKGALLPQARFWQLAFNAAYTLAVRRLLHRLGPFSCHRPQGAQAAGYVR